MFGRKDENQPESTEMTTSVNSPVARADQPAAAPRATPTPAMTRRIVEIPGSRRSSASAGGNGERRLTVGAGLSLSGEITSCDILVVEGKVEAKLSDGKLLEIAEAGQFRGAVEIENADIAGRYDGQLVVHGRLTVRSTGRISGMIKYGELEINAGGQIIGEMQVTGGGAQQQSMPSTSFKSAAKFTALTEDEDASEGKSDRKSA